METCSQVPGVFEQPGATASVDGYRGFQKPQKPPT